MLAFRTCFTLDGSRLAGSLILEQLVRKMEIMPVTEEMIRSCKPFLPEKEVADTVYVATCLQTGTILITNDGDFDVIRDEGITEVWNISATIQRILS